MTERLEEQNFNIEPGTEQLAGLPTFDTNNYEAFEVELRDCLKPDMSADEQVTQVILAALRIEFGTGFGRESNIVRVIKEAVLNNQEKQEEVALVAQKMMGRDLKKFSKPVN